MNTKPLTNILCLLIALIFYTGCGNPMPAYTNIDTWYNSLVKKEQQLYQKAIYQLGKQAKRDTLVDRTIYESVEKPDTLYLYPRPNFPPLDTLTKIPRQSWGVFLIRFNLLDYYDIRTTDLDAHNIPYFNTDTSSLIGLDIYDRNSILSEINNYLKRYKRDINKSINWQYNEFEYLVQCLKIVISVNQCLMMCYHHHKHSESCEKIYEKVKKLLLRDSFKEYAIKLSLPGGDTSYMNFDGFPLEFLYKKQTFDSLLKQQFNNLYKYNQELRHDYPQNTWANYLPRFNQIIDSLNHIIHYIDDLGYFDMEVEIINQSKFNKQLEAYCWAISGDILYKSFAQERLKALGIHRKSNREYMIWAEWYRKWVEEKRLFDFVKERKKMSIE